MNLGKMGEQLACQYLIDEGLILIQKNFRLRYGEIDLIMKEQDILVFVEVKYRSSQAFGGGLAAVTRQKQQKIKLTAQLYLQSFVEPPVVRFDVIEVSPTELGFRFEWVKGAFE